MNPTTKSNISLFKYWIKERNDIYQKKEIQKLLPPWTNDPILQKYKFTNWDRSKDRVTRYLVDNIFVGDDLGLTLHNIVAHRYCSKEETSKRIGIIKNDYKDLIAYHKEASAYTGAFIRCHSLDEAIKTFDKIYEDRDELVRSIRKHNTLQFAFEAMNSYKLLGRFMAWQIVCDMTLTEILPNPSDIDDFVVLGKSARNGLAILGNPDIKTLKMHMNTRLRKHGIQMTLIDIEHSLCEFYKYHKAVHQNKRPKQIYKY